MKNRMNGKWPQVLAGILGVMVAALMAYIVATSNVDAMIDRRVESAQKPILRAIEQLTIDVRELRSILLGKNVDIQWTQ